MRRTRTRGPGGTLASGEDWRPRDPRRLVADRGVYYHTGLNFNLKFNLRAAAGKPRARYLWPLGSQNKPGLTALRPLAKKAACANVERDACLWRSVCPTPPLGRPRGGERVQIDARDAENSAFSVRWLNATSSSLVPPSPLASTEPCDLLWQDHDLNERP